MNNNKTKTLLILHIISVLALGLFAILSMIFDFSWILYGAFVSFFLVIVFAFLVGKS